MILPVRSVGAFSGIQSANQAEHILPCGLEPRVTMTMTDALLSLQHSYRLKEDAVKRRRGLEPGEEVASSPGQISQLRLAVVLFLRLCALSLTRGVRGPAIKGQRKRPVTPNGDKNATTEPK
ncbi:hypothetical protein MHYP_G00093110 [Metynnis hypsauchen]